MTLNVLKEKIKMIEAALQTNIQLMDKIILQ